MSACISLAEEEVKYVPIVISFEHPFTTVCSFLETSGIGLRSPQRVHYLLEHILRSIFMPYEWSQAIELNISTTCGVKMDKAVAREDLVQLARWATISALEDIVENIVVNPTKYFHYYDGRDSQIPNVVVFAPTTVFNTPIPEGHQFMTAGDVRARISQFSSQERVITQNRRYRQPGTVEMITSDPKGTI
jgi:hypothetical protein